MHRNEFIHEFVFTTTLSLTNAQTVVHKNIPHSPAASIPHTQSRLLEANQRSPRASRAVGAVLLAAWGPRLRHVGAAGRDGENRRLLPLQPHSMLLNIVLQTRDILVRDNQN